MMKKMIFTRMFAIVFVAFVMVGCATLGRPFFAFPSDWPPAISTTERSNQQAQFRKDDAECRELYYKGRDAGKTDDEAFVERRKCMEAKGYRYTGRI